MGDQNAPERIDVYVSDKTGRVGHVVNEDDMYPQGWTPRAYVPAEAYDRAITERDEARAALKRIARRFWHKHSSGLSAYEVPALSADRANEIARGALPTDMLYDPCHECGGDGVLRADNYRWYKDRPCWACGGSGNAPRAALAEGEQHAADLGNALELLRDGPKREWNPHSAEGEQPAGETEGVAVPAAGEQSTTGGLPGTQAVIAEAERTGAREVVEWLRRQVESQSTTETVDRGADLRGVVSARSTLDRVSSPSTTETGGTQEVDLVRANAPGVIGVARMHLRDGGADRALRVLDDHAERVRAALRIERTPAAPATPEGPERCPACRGRGEQVTYDPAGRPAKVRACPACGGSGATPEGPGPTLSLAMEVRLGEELAGSPATPEGPDVD